jgi:hypothetical protein
MAKDRVLSAPSLTHDEQQEIVLLLEKAVQTLQTVPEKITRLNTFLADLRHRVEVLEQKQPGKRPKRTR